MIHEIAPHKFNNEFKVADPKATDFVIRYNGSKTLLKKEGESLSMSSGIRNFAANFSV